jgi:hypothetical protein
MKGALIVLCYVDDCLIFCQDKRKYINTNLSKKFILTDEVDVAAYLGINVNRIIEDGTPQFKLT